MAESGNLPRPSGILLQEDTDGLNSECKTGN
jgi:hypothetical protein